MQTKSKTITRNGIKYFPRQDITVVMILGIDWEGKVEPREMNYGGAVDMVSLMIFDKKTQDCTLLNLNRDMMVHMPALNEHGKAEGFYYGQLAYSHTYGTGMEDSCENTRTTISNLLYGLHIDYYFAMHMDAISILNDAVGGVTVNITDDFSAVAPTLTVGSHTLKGKEAVAFVQSRTGVGDELNLSRMDVILMYFGTGAVKGFAVSLAIGIAASLFTALFMSRVLFDWLLVIKPDVKLSMLRFFSKPSIPFLKQSRIAVPVSLVLIVLSLVMFGVKNKNMLSVDFTGGTLLSYAYSEQVPVADLEKSLQRLQLPGKVTYKSSASQSDNRKIEILLRDGYEKKFSTGSMGIAQEIQQSLNQSYPQLNLRDGSSTIIGALVGMEMTRNAVISLVLAFLGMIVYVSLRYEFNYAIAGILALVHDVILSLGVFILSGREMSLAVVAGLLTIIGYSINDTIVIFDRIREERKLYPEKPFEAVVDDSLNRTLSRTVLTSLTTFLVVAVMLILGGIAISDFMLVIALGIIIGSYSSLYVASPIIVFYHQLRKKHGHFVAEHAVE